MQLMNQQRWWLFYYDETHSTCLFGQSSSEVGFVPPERRVDKTKQNKKAYIRVQVYFVQVI
jgi:hypothetical protein